MSKNIQYGETFYLGSRNKETIDINIKPLAGQRLILTGTVLPNGTVPIGNGEDILTPRVISGDITISNTGVATISSNTGVVASNDVALAKVSVNSQGRITSISTTPLTENNIWVGDTNNLPTQVPISSVVSTASLPEANIWVGNASGQPVAVPVSGDLEMLSTGEFHLIDRGVPTNTYQFATITPSSNGLINNISAVSLASGKLWVGNGSGAPIARTITGDISINANGQATISDIPALVTGTYPLSNTTVNSQGRITSISKSSLTEGKLWVGNVLNEPVEVSMYGDATLDSDGKLNLSHINPYVDEYKLASVQANLEGRITQIATTNLNTGKVWVGDTLTNYPQERSITGDVSMDYLGQTTLNDTTVTPASYNIANITVNSQGRITSASSSTLASGKLWVGNGSSAPIARTITGDLSIDANGASALASIITPDSFGFITGITVDAKGRVTSISDAGNTPGTVIVTNAGGFPTAQTISGDATISDTGQLNLNATGVVEDNYVLPTLFINSKGLVESASSATLTSNYLWLGNGTNTPVAVQLSGDITTNNTGLTTLNNTTVTPASYNLSNITVNSQGRITAASSSTLANNSIWIGNGSGAPVARTLSGDITTNNTGLTTLANSGVSAGSYTIPNITVDAKGRITSASNLALTNNKILMGNASNVPTERGLNFAEVGIDGNLKLTDTGVVANAYEWARVNVAADGRIIGIMKTPLDTDYILIGDLTGNPARRLVSGDATLDNLGILTLATVPTITPNSYILPTLTVDAKGRITSIAATTLNEGQVWIGNTANRPTARTISGDATLNASGALTLSTIPDLIAGTYYFANVTVDNKGRISSIADGSIYDIPLTQNKLIIGSSFGYGSETPYTFPATVPAKSFLYATSATAVSTITTTASAILKTNGSGDPTFSQTLGTAVTDNITTLGTITSAINNTNTTNATSKDTGAIITDGGIGVEKDIYVQGSATTDIAQAATTLNLGYKAQTSPTTTIAWGSVSNTPPGGRAYHIYQCYSYSPKLGMLITVPRLNGSPGTIYWNKTTDFVNWTEITLSATFDNTQWLGAITWCPELEIFVALPYGSGTSGLWSNDGVNWNTMTIPANGGWRALEWCNSWKIFVATGDNLAVWSPDGLNWTVGTNYTQVLELLWCQDKKILVGLGNGLPQWTEDGKTWNSGSIGTITATVDFRGIAYSPTLKLFSGLAYQNWSGIAAERAMWSLDGKSWSSTGVSGINENNNFLGYTWSPVHQCFVAPYSATVSYVSYDGKAFVATSNFPSVQCFYCQYLVDKNLLITGNNGGQVQLSTKVGVVNTENIAHDFSRTIINGSVRFTNQEYAYNGISGSGALETLGGVNIGKNLWVGDEITSKARIRSNSTVEANGSTGSLMLAGGANIAKNITLGSNGTNSGIRFAPSSNPDFTIGTTTGSSGWIDIPCSIDVKGTGSKNPVFACWNTAHSNNMWEHSFDAATEHECFFSIHVPHDYTPNTGIYFHVHWLHNVAGATGAIQWNFDYSYSGPPSAGNVRQAFNGTTTTVSIIETVSPTQYAHSITEIASPVLAGSLEVDGVIMVRMWRDGNLAGDTFTGTAFVLFVDCHMNVSKFSTLNRNKQSTGSFYT